MIEFRLNKTIKIGDDLKDEEYLNILKFPDNGYDPNKEFFKKEDNLKNENRIER